MQVAGGPSGLALISLIVALWEVELVGPGL